MAILVVDDDAGARERLSRSLQESGDGWEARQAASAQEALALVPDAGIEGVLLDSRLPDADGLTCLRELRRLHADVPVVIVTGSGSEPLPSRR